MIPFSVLDLSPVTLGGTAAQSLRNTLDLAQHAETWGYRRYWLAEHHSMPGIASAATSVVICHVASGTSAIRVGAGGIMLPNHSPRWKASSPAESISGSAGRRVPIKRRPELCAAISPRIRTSFHKTSWN
jgi:hypothetical protein